MTFAELKALYDKESARLDEAAENNDFQSAAEIEAKMYVRMAGVESPLVSLASYVPSRISISHFLLIT
jgi:hypothetical protein